MNTRIPSIRLAATALIVFVALVRLAYLAWVCPLDLSPDEAYYWDWSRHLDWSYHSKGPLVAWLIRASCAIFGDSMLAVRLPAVVCGSLLLSGLYVLTVQIHRNEKLALGVVAAALTLPIVAAGLMLMTIDAPFLCAWTWALVFAQRAVFHDSSWAWPATGVCVALGFLAKHTMVLWLPSFGLFLISTPALRPTLRQPGVWVMAAVGSMGAVPILAWNAMHGWVTLEHTQMHAGMEASTVIDLLGPLRYVGSQFGILLGFWFVAWAWGMWRHRPTREARPNVRYLWWMSMPTFVFFGLFSLKNGGGEANWPLAGYVSGAVLLAPSVAEVLQCPVAWQRRFSLAGMAIAVALGLLLTIVLHEPIRAQPVLLQIAGPATRDRPMPIRRVDPTTRLRGWRHLAAEVDRTRRALQARGIDPVLAAERWTHAAELRFYGEDHPDVFCVGMPLGDRRSQYDLWRPNPVADADAFRGRTFLIVGLDLHRLRPAFESFEPMQTVSYVENSCPIAEWSITVAHGFRGWGKMDAVKSD